jgi:hypothetical protein
MSKIETSSDAPAKALTTGDVALDTRILALAPYILKRTITAYPELAPGAEIKKLSDQAQSAADVVKKADFGCRRNDIAKIVSIILGEDITTYVSGDQRKLIPEAWTVLVINKDGVRNSSSNYTADQPVLVLPESVGDKSMFQRMKKLSGATGNGSYSNVDYYRLPTEDEVKEILFSNVPSMKPLFDLIDVAKSIPA